jgi:class 3 adenylate cyclase
MQEALPELNAAFETEHGITLANHIGVNTGEVVAGDASLGQRLVTGDTVNVAARLGSDAGPGELVISEAAWRAAGRDGSAERRSLAVKGRAAPLDVVVLRAASAAAVQPT